MPDGQGKGRWVLKNRRTGEIYTDIPTFGFGREDEYDWVWVSEEEPVGAGGEEPSPIPTKKKKPTRRLLKGQIEVPPEIEELFGPTEKEEWGIEGWDFLPPEITPQNYFTYLRRNEPHYVYYLQLLDYVAQRSVPYVDEEGVKRAPAFLTQHEAKTLSPAEAKALVRKKANAILEDAKFYIGLGQPVETLPFYEEVSRTIGPNVKREYEDELVNFVQEYQEELEEKAETRKYLLDKYTPQTAEGRMDLLRGVEEGIVTQEEAYGAPGIQRSPEERRQEQARRNLERFGEGTSSEILAEQGEVVPAKEGEVVTPWVEWARAMAEEGNARMFAGQKLSPENMSLLREMQQYGIPVDEGMISTLRMSDIRQEDPGLGAARYQIMESLRRAKQAELEGKSTWYSQMMPDAFQEYVKGFSPNPEGMKAGYLEQSFLPWLQREENKQKIPDFETKMFKDYGDILPEYQNYLERNRFQGVKPIESWIRETPEISDYWQKRQERRMKSLASRGSEF